MGQKQSLWESARSNTTYGTDGKNPRVVVVAPKTDNKSVGSTGKQRAHYLYGNVWKCPSCGLHNIHNKNVNGLNAAHLCYGCNFDYDLN